MIRTLHVDPGAAHVRLDVYLATALSVSRSQAAHLLAKAAVSVNDQPQRASYLVQPGDIVAIAPNTGAGENTPPSTPRLPIVYEDEDILVIDKPAGLAAHPGNGVKSGPTVADFARLHTTDPDPLRPGIVHRLDRDTSGLMILAKTPEAKAFMQQQFRDHAVHKTYTLLCVGRVKPPEALIQLPIDRDPANPVRRAVLGGGKAATTRYQTTANYPGYSLITANPQTGRTHQLRLHFAALGHPIAGDTIYGAAKRPLGLKRQFLHASAVEFTAPSGTPVNLTSPLPADLQNTIEMLAKSV